MANYRVPILDYFIWQRPVEDKDLSSAPSGPSKGDSYIIGDSAPSGDAWAGHEGDITYYNGSAWVFITKEEGMFVYVKDEDELYYYITSWNKFTVADTGYTTTFDNDDLSSGVLTVTHNLGNTYCQTQVFDNNSKLIIPDEITLTGANTLTVDLSSYGTITGTWRVIVLDVGATVAGTNSAIQDADGDTKIQVEESADEDKIRFDAGGTQEAQIDSDGLTLKSGASVNELSTDDTLAGDSDDAVPTEKAVKGYVDNALAGISSDEIKDADNDTKIQVEESADEDKIRMDTGGVERFILDSTGRTMPTQPAFCVTKSAAQDNIAVGSNVTVTFDIERFDQGNNFASNTFTAPVTGKYLLSVSLNIAYPDGASDYYIINIVTSNRNYAFLFDPGDLASDPLYWSVSHSALCDMDASDTAYIFIKQASGAAQTDIRSTDTFFSGVLIC
jgi:hypothetical protein